jgi:high-affinity iron transporter
LDLRWLVRPGTIQSALLTGMLGVQSQPTIGELLGWTVYFLPMSFFVLLAHRRRPRPVTASALASPAQLSEENS